jgi:hypothetical protein
MTDFPASLEQFRSIVLADPTLQQELRQAPDRASFVRLVVARAREQDCALDADMVEAALDAAARHQLLSQWIER